MHLAFFSVWFKVLPCLKRLKNLFFVPIENETDNDLDTNTEYIIELHLSFKNTQQREAPGIWKELAVKMLS